MAAANSTGLVALARAKNGAPLFSNPCPDCGKARLGQKGQLGNRCIKCACVARDKRPRPPRLQDHPLYTTWVSMRARCRYPSVKAYRFYGARGIYVCQEWLNDFGAFVEWAEANGYAPGLEIDRIDSDGPYAPGNCQFITHIDNSRKSRWTQCTKERARAIKEALARGQRVRAIARSEGFSDALVQAIKDGRTWRDV